MINIPQLRLSSQNPLQHNISTVQELVSAMGAMQAQDYTMSKWAIGLRLPKLSHKDIETAIQNGEILRTHIMRPTWHWVSAADIRWLLALTAPKIKSGVQSRDRDLGLNEAMFEKSNFIISQALKGNKHLTREELSVHLEQGGIEINSFRINHMMMRAELDALICSGIPKGKKQTYALLEERVAKQKTLSREESLALLTKKYVPSHGAATIDDFVWWSGLSKTDARNGIEMNSALLTSQTLDGQVYYFDSGAQIQSTNNIHLLPAFDEYIISYRDRKAVLTSEHHSKIISSNGIFRPAIIQNGMVIGMWRKVTKKNMPVVETDYFHQIDKQAHAKVQDQIDLYIDFCKNINR